MSPLLQPLEENKRESILDVLRGFALAGVLFIFCVSDIGKPSGYSDSLADEIISWPKWILIENRMFTMLILIFGIGFFVQLDRAKQHGVSLVPVFLRRLTGLLIIGFLHAILLSTRDILMFYALAGMALLLARNASNRRLLVFISVVFLLLVTPVVQTLFGNPWQKAASLSQPNNYSDHIQYNWQYFKLYHQVYTIYLDMLFHFLIGFWIGKTGLLKKIATNKKFRRRLLLITLICTAILIPGYYFWIEPEIAGKVYGMDNSWQKFLAITGLRLIWQIWMMVSVILYGTIIIGLFASGVGKRFFIYLAAFGRMALSNYLLQSIILVPILLALDRFNNIPAFTGFIIFLILFAFQMVFSHWWLRRYKLGPFEWLLRSITYWNWEPIKKNVAAV